MLISDFDYDLPDELIAQYPAADRRGSRLLELGQHICDRQFDELPGLLRPGDLLVFNDTRVIKARLSASKETGGRAEILIERVQGERRVLAHVKASKTPKPGSRLFSLNFSTDVMPFIERHGEVPLPPYLGRAADDTDIDRYQTVYAKDPGAVAAPTAGLHFDTAMLEETRNQGVRHAWVTLHVGAGTFQSLREEHIKENRLHSERVQVDEKCCDAIRETKEAGGRVIAVGTTSVRALECSSASGTVQPFDGETDMFILPGYKFQVVDAMITNFHLP
ncbi:MAG: tRNA preQ1(34) S-adenosylmethionine ribosyltransferase-isomerase QueA, partial [Gammaproteobacteria bacterium]|nr:tRNA preQ1(34) S-adenosylmethionine ribosyltransferase-isomerase QueA [Gammaproteobacteria bacterium]